MTGASSRELDAPRTKLFRGLGEPSRLRILEALVEGRRSVSEITEATGLSQSNTSNHLSCLLGCGLVAREQRGRFVYYRLADAKLVSLLSLAEEIADGVAPDLMRCPHCSAKY